jgi:uncharacterized protein (UPF0248 family)
MTWNQTSGFWAENGEHFCWTGDTRIAMTPIHEVLNRIRWDKEFAKGAFQLGYYDRTEDRIILVSLTELNFPSDNSQTFELTDAEGQIHRVPFHRVRELYKDSQRIWHRPAQG